MGAVSRYSELRGTEQSVSGEKWGADYSKLPRLPDEDL